LILENAFNLLADRAAYEGGQAVGRIVGYIVLGLVVLFVLKKLFSR